MPVHKLCNRKASRTKAVLLGACVFTKWHKFRERPGSQAPVTNSGEIGERCAVNGQEQWIFGGFEFAQNRCSDGPGGQRWGMRQIPVSGALSLLCRLVNALGAVDGGIGW